MLSVLKHLKGVVAPRWKTPKLLCVSSFLSSPCGCHNLNRGRKDLSQKKLHVSISHSLNTKYITSTRLYSTFKSQSLVTQASSSSSSEEEVAYQVFDNIVSELEKNPTYINDLCSDHIIKLCRKRHLRAAVTLLQLLRDKHAINSLPAYNLLLAAACEAFDMEIVSRIFKNMLVHQLPLNSNTYFNVAKAVSRSNDSSSVLVFVKEISELTCTQNVTVINRIIYAFADCGHVENALLVFHHMKGLKYKPDLITYNIMLGILGKAGQVDEMLNLFAVMKKENYDIAPDVVSYNTILNSLRKIGRFDLCVLVWEEMGKVGLERDLRSYTVLIEGFGRTGNIEESLRLFEEMKRVHIRPSVYVYRSIISNLKRVGKLTLALEFEEEMKECKEDLVGPKDFKKKKCSSL